jgi:hypothetical protein
VVFSDVDNRVFEGDNNIVGGNSTFNAAGNISNVRVVQTDYGAIAHGVGLAESSLDLVEKAMLGSNELATESIETVVAFAGDALDYIESVDEERSEETLQVVNTVSELAKVVQTGGESLKSDLNKYAVIGLVIVAGLVVWQSNK